MRTLTEVVIIAVYTAALLYVIRRLIQAQDELARTTDELHAERKRRWQTEDQANTLVGKVTPLIEKSDWMSGRWHGQFDTLVRLENQRNAAVEDARRVIWSIPLVADYIRDTTAGELQ